MKTELSLTEKIEDAVQVLNGAYRELANFLGYKSWEVQAAISKVEEELLSASDYSEGYSLSKDEYEDADCYRDIPVTFDHWRVSKEFKEGYSDGLYECDE